MPDRFEAYLKKVGGDEIKSHVAAFFSSQLTRVMEDDTPKHADWRARRQGQRQGGSRNHLFLIMMESAPYVMCRCVAIDDAT